jgi:hypothetical protein
MALRRRTKAGWATVSFAASKPVESRFIRLTQTAHNRDAGEYFHGRLGLESPEFYGMLSAEGRLTSLDFPMVAAHPL